MNDLKRIGWWVWNIKTPHHKEFSVQALTEADRKHGYRAQPVYIKETEADV